VTPKTLFIGNLSYRATAAELVELYARFGGANARVVEGKGIGYVDVDESLVGEAIAVTHDHEFRGRKLRVKLA
jgi:RNA recognition motif-containing protein